MRRAALLVLLLCVTAAEARAECMAPSPVIFPLGDEVGPNPMLYRFSPEYQADQPLRIVGVGGEPVTYTIADVSTPDTGIRVSQIVVQHRGDFVVHAGEYTAPRRFHVRAEGDAFPATITVEDVRWIEEAWTCSHTQGLAVSLRSPGVAAIRARWSDGFEAIVPPNDRGFFFHGAMGGEIDPQALRVLLGHPNCVANVIPDRYIERMDVELYAIYSDGRVQEVPLRRKPAEPEPPPPQAECGLAHASRQPPPAHASSPSSAPWWIAGAAGLGGLVTVVLVLLVRRRRVTAVP